jgi:hypothetical protein
VLTGDELAALFGAGAGDGTALRRALEEGLVRREGDAYVVDSPRLLAVGAELVAAGVPLEAVIERRRALRDELDAVAAGFVELIAAHVFEPLGEPIAPSEVPRLSELVRRLRPLAQEAVSVELADAMERQVQARLSEWMSRLLEHREPSVPASGRPGRQLGRESRLSRT